MNQRGMQMFKPSEMTKLVVEALKSGLHKHNCTPSYQTTMAEKALHLRIAQFLRNVENNKLDVRLVPRDE